LLILSQLKKQIAMPLKIKRTALQFFLALFSILITFAAFAQQKRVTGRILGVDGNPVAGASISVTGTTTGTQTDTSGNFSISVPAGRNALTVSSVGFETQNVTISASNSITATLRPAASNLNEVVVTGYSGQQRKNIVGAVSTVKGEQLAAVPSGNAEQQFQGRIPGVTVITSGQPGAVSQVRIRGFGSFSANAPLYVVDGIPTTNIDFLNPNDIETTTVLKDASSASIYGARAAAGVIIMTTKKGRSGKLRVTYDVSYGSTFPGKGLDLLTPQQQADMTWVALKAAGQVDTATGNPTHPQYGSGPNPVLPDYLKVGNETGLSGLSPTDPRLDPTKFNTDFDKGPIYQVIKANKQGTDWYDALTEQGYIQNHTLGFSGGTENARYYAGLSYYDEKGVVINTNLKRYSLRLNNEFRIKPFIRVGSNFQYTYRDNPNLGQSPASENDIMFALTINPLIPVYDEGGGYAGTTARGFNNSTQPVARRIRSRQNRGFSGTIFGNVFAEVDIVPKLTARTSFGGFISQFQNRFLNFRTYENSENVGSYTFGEGAGYGQGYTWTNTLHYQRDFGNHSIEALAGMEAVADGFFRQLSGSGLNPFTTSFNFTTLTNTDPNGRNLNSGGQPLRKLYSQFGQVNYNFNNRYLLSGTLRRDGSSVFGEKDKYGIFPAVSAGWRISQEDFMKSVDWITELKIRGGWGIMGNERPVGSANRFNTIGGSPATTGYDINATQTSVVSGIRTTGVGDPFVKWEENTTFNIGFDGTFFKNRLDVIVDVYKRKTEDLLFNQALPASLGDVSAPFINIGAMENSGVDLMLSYRGRTGRAFRYEADVIFTTYNNKITRISEITNYFDVNFTNRIGGGVVRNVVGQPVSTFYGYKVLGLFKVTKRWQVVQSRLVLVRVVLNTRM
jgi:TonB-linked SusC/RagA family outer membrane protein